MGPGEHTEDLIALRRPHPAEQIADDMQPPTAGDTVKNAKSALGRSEHDIRRYGSWCLFTGLIGGLVTIGVVLGLQNSPPLGSSFLRFSALMFMFTGFAAAFTAGLIERLTRYGRTLARANTVQLAELIRQAERIRAQGSDNGMLIHENSEQLVEVVQRVEAMEKVIARVPAYPEAVLDGVDLARGIPGDHSRST